MSDKTNYPPITLAECDAFERHAHDGAQVDLEGEGVKYSCIQPYDLVRFCQTVRSLRAALSTERTTAYLHRSLKPLDEVDFRSDEDLGQLNAFENECEGMCGV